MLHLDHAEVVGALADGTVVVVDGKVADPTEVEKHFGSVGAFPAT